MRPHSALPWIAIAAVLAASACSRLTFVKPKAGRGSYEQVAPVYDFKQGGSSKARLATRDQLAMAEQDLRRGDLAKAEAGARAALKAEPASVDANTMLGVITAQRGSQVQAGQFYAKAAELAPTRGSVLNNYGTWLCANGRAAESLAWFDRALADPGYASASGAWANAGACALDAGQTSVADRNLRQALSGDPQDAVALGAMAQLQYNAGRFMDARAFSERRLAAAPPSAQSLQLASQIESRLGDTRAADRYVQRLRAEFPQASVIQPGVATPP